MSDIKKIALVLDTFSVGGIESVAFDYITLLSRKGYEIDVYVLDPSQVAMVNKLPLNVSTHTFSFNRKLCPELYSYGVMNWWWGKYVYPLIHPVLMAMLKLRKLFTKIKTYDVAIAFSGHINDLTFVVEGFVKAKQKICWCHGTLLSYLAICDGYPKLYKKIDKFVTLSEQGLSNVYAGHRYLYDKTIMNIYNPVLIKDKKLNNKHVEELKTKYGKYVLMVARMTYQKDHLTAIKAIELLHDRGVDIKIVFLGDGEKLGEYKKFVADHNLTELCHFEGNRTDVNDYIAGSHVNLLASRFEGLPTVMIEAMAFEKPCIMTNSDGGEVTAFGKYGFLTPLGDFQAIAEAIQLLYQNEEVYEHYSKLSKERFKDFDPENIIRQLEMLLSK